MKHFFIVTAVLAIAAAIWLVSGARDNMISEQGTPTPTPTPVVSASTAPTSSPEGRMIGEAIAVRDFVIREFGLTLDQVLIMDATTAQWPNGCLGLANSEEYCTQAIVPGWRITIKIKNGATYIYRTNTGATTIRREF